MDNNGQPLQNISAQDFQQKVAGNPFLQSAMAGYLQPGAQLQQTEAQIPLTQQEKQTSGASQGIITAQTPGAQANSAIDQQKLAANNYINQINNKFSQYTSRGKPVPADIYNQAKGKLPPGLDSDTFDSYFAHNTDPNNVWQYNTQAGFNARTQRSQILNPLVTQANNLTQEYNAIGNKGYGADITKFIPGLGGSQKQYENDAAQFQKSLDSLSSNKNLAQLGINPEEISTLRSKIPNVYGSAEEQQAAAKEFQENISNISNKVKAFQSPPSAANGILSALGLTAAKNDMQDIVEGGITKSNQPILDKASQQATQLEQQASQSQDPQQKIALLKEANNIRSQISQTAGNEGANFSADVNQNPLLRALKGGAEVGVAAQGVTSGGGLLRSLLSKSSVEPAASIATKSVPTTTLQNILTSVKNSPTNPLSYAGKQIAQIAKSAGEMPNTDTLEAKFGTYRNPNTGLIQGESSLANTAKKGGLYNLLKSEVSAQTPSSGELGANPSYSDILNARKGAYKESWDKLSPKSQQGFYKNVGRAYKEVLHEDVPEIKNWDSAYSAMSKVAKVAPILGKGLMTTLGLGGAFETYNVLNGAFRGK